MGFLDNPNEYESWINRSLVDSKGVHFRSPRLKEVIRAIRAYVADPIGGNLTAVEDAVKRWKDTDHKEYGNRGASLEKYLDKEIAGHGRRVWGVGAIRMVDRSCHPRWEPHVWAGAVQTSTNCYAYACNDPNGHPQGKPQPGQAGGYWGWVAWDEHRRPQMTDASVRLAVMVDDQTRHNRRLGQLIPLIRLRNDPVPDSVVNVPGHYLIALVTDQGGRDYHWLRQDDDGMWSHKPGSDPVTNVDGSNAPISDPRTCNLNYPRIGIWYRFTTFYYAPRGGVRTGELGHANAA